MTRKMQLTPETQVMPPEAGTGLPFAAKEEGAIVDKALGFYWDIFLLGNPEDHQQRRAFSLSFEDDFDEDLEEAFDEDEYFDEDVFLPREDLLKEDDGFLDEEDGHTLGLRNELYYK